jgi:hypothetical protein
MRTAAVLGLIGLLGLNGCAHLPRAGEGPRHEPVVVEAPADELWDVLPEIYERLDLGGAFADERNRTFGLVRLVALWTPWIGPFDAPYVRCTFNAVAAPVVAAGRRSAGIRVPAGYVTLTVATTLTPLDGGTEVLTRVAAVPTDIGGGATQNHAAHCVSTGRLEDRVLEMLEDLRAEPVEPA